MELKQLFKASAIATALVLAGCGGDINISEGDIDNSVTNNNGGNTGGDTGGDTGSDDTAPGEVSSFLSGEVSDAFGQSVEVRVLSGRLTADDADDQGVITLTNDKVWALEGPVFIGNDKADSVTLAIEEGTVIFGRTGADYLVVSRDSQIEAEGTASAPIIMTSFNDIEGIPATANKWLLTDLLRDEWGFEGFVVSDWGSIGEMKDHGFAEDDAHAAAIAAIAAKILEVSLD